MKKLLIFLMLYGVLIVFNDGEKIFLPKATFVVLIDKCTFIKCFHYRIFQGTPFPFKQIMTIPAENVKYYLIKEKNEE